MKKVHHFFVAAELDQPQVKIDDTKLAHQMLKVIKLAPGERIVLCDGKGMKAVAEIVSVGTNMVEVKIVETSRLPAPREVYVYCALLKKDVFELVAQKVTELGVTHIIPLVSARTVKQSLNYPRLQAIIREAAEQSERGTLPELHEAVALETALDRHIGASVLFFDPSGERLSAFQTAPGPLALFIGPEGGWSDEEAALARGKGVHIASLGAGILRAETAAIAAAWWAQTLID